MSDFAERAAEILHNLSLERPRWPWFFRRWYYPDEPLRNDAANLLREYDIEMPRPYGTRRVGDDR